MTSFIKPFLRMSQAIVMLTILQSCVEKESVINELPLEGTWALALDSLDIGETNQWFAKSTNEWQSVKLPGSLAEQNLGNDVSVNTHWTGNMWNDSAWYKDERMAKYREDGNVKISFWLTPRKVFYGAAWYKKEIELPSDWSEENIILFLERPHWETTLWVNGTKIGMQNTLGTPHSYLITNQLNPGKNTITIRVDNRIKEVDVGMDAHSISDNTQTNWNGIVGEIKLIRSPKISMSNIQLYPDVNNKEVIIKGSLNNSDRIYEDIMLEIQATANTTGDKLESSNYHLILDDAGNFQVVYSMGENPLLWDEFSPNLYTLSLQLKTNDLVQKKEISFGMRDFKVDGKHFAINGRPVFLRGTLECAIFPLTGYPPTDIVEWTRILEVIKNHGLNHVRFHSWCPPEAAFTAADKLGVYLQVEASAWTTIGDGEPIDEWIYKEAESIISNYGNHPSFVMMAYGNEPSGKNQNEYLKGFVDHMKSLDSRRLYTSGAGWPLLDNLDYFNHKGPRIQGWAQELNSVINAQPPQTMFDYDDLIQHTPIPYVSHEMGQWCVYPNFNEISKYTGVLQPKNFEIFKETLEANGMGYLADSFHLASGKLQAICYKADIEAALRTKDMAGFQLLDLHDFPGQGTALVGILDPFWDSKDYITPEEFRRFNGVTVPLVRLPKRVYMSNESLEAEVEVAHYGSAALEKVMPTWRLVSGSDVLADGELSTTTIPIGNGINLGTISVGLTQINRPTKIVLEVSVLEHTNTWDIWVYPHKNEKISDRNDFMVVDRLDESTLEYLKNGGRVLLNISKGDIREDKGGSIGVGFSSIFWNTSWTNGQKPHTLGILCNPNHPALSEFPTEYHSNWQWWDAMSHSNAIVLDDLDPNLKPIVRIIDDWFENRRTALIFEVKVGEGKLLLSGIDLHSDLENRLEARQLRYSLEKYISGDSFNPNISVSKEELLSFFNKN
jgi:hypothetical protein